MCSEMLIEMSSELPTEMSSEPPTEMCRTTWGTLRFRDCSTNDFDNHNLCNSKQ
jgi:hypothetical protein